MPGSWRSVQPSWASIRRQVVGVGRAGAAAEVHLGDALVGDRHGQPGVDRREVGAGDALQVLARGRAARLVRVLASCSPRGTNTGSGTRIRPVRSKK